MFKIIKRIEQLVVVLEEIKGSKSNKVSAMAYAGVLDVIDGMVESIGGVCVLEKKLENRLWEVKG